MTQLKLQAIMLFSLIIRRTTFSLSYLYSLIWYQQQIQNMIQKTKSSQRQLLINRAKCHQISTRLRNNIEQIEEKTEKLSRSRCSSVSSRSHQLSRLNHSMQGRKKSPKIQLLQNIVDKLKSAKIEINKGSYIQTKDKILTQELYPTPQKQIQRKIKIQQKIEDVIKDSPPRRKNKLQSMLKDIKKCNQQSTKAVNTIKKNIIKDTDYSGLTPFSLPNQNKYKSIKQEIGETLTEIVSLKQELRKAQQENKLLNNIIQINQITEQKTWNKGKKCQKCGCSCYKKENQVESQLKVKQTY